MLGAVGQTARNAMQRGLTPRLGALGATLVRFLFGFPFALLFLAAVLSWTHAGLPAINREFALWTLMGALTKPQMWKYEPPSEKERNRKRSAHLYRR